MGDYTSASIGQSGVEIGMISQSTHVLMYDALGNPGDLDVPCSKGVSIIINFTSFAQADQIVFYVNNDQKSKIALHTRQRGNYTLDPLETDTTVHIVVWTGSNSIQQIFYFKPS